MAHHIVIGYDGSDDAGLALDWAAAEAQRQQLPLTVLRVLDLVSLTPGLLIPPVRVDPADGIAAEGVLRARKTASTIDVTAATVIETVGYGLVESSRTADLLVIGTRGHGERVGALLGSVAFAVSGHTFCPLVVVRGDSTAAAGPQYPVVVGADGSAGSDAAVRFAATTAAAASAPLIVVTVYPSAASPVWSGADVLTGEHGGGPTFGSAVEQAARDVSAAATQLAQADHPGLSVRGLIVEGRPSETLSAQALGCGLLVVGSRGRGGFAGLMLGSVGHGVIHTSPCPVAIITDRS